MIYDLIDKALAASPISRDVEEFVPQYEGNVDVNDPRHRWTLIPDGSGKMHLIDLNPYEGEAIEPMFNAQNDVFFLLFTPRNPTSGQRLSTNDANAIRNTQWNSGAPTRFVIHGWNNDAKSAVNTQITAAYVARGNFNVVVC
jgi:pancreatic triacylglycerol lipase